MKENLKSFPSIVKRVLPKIFACPYLFTLTKTFLNMKVI